ncbi:hypothetical protein FRB99_005798, partial [Tulasnella sp. 403]
MQFSYSGRLLVGLKDPDVVVWDLTKREVREVRPLGRRDLVSTDISSDDTFCATGCEDGTILVWDLDDKEKTRSHSMKSPLRAIAISPGREVLAVGIRNTGVLVVSIDTFEILATFHCGWIWSVRFSPDSRLLFGACGDRIARCWNVGNLQKGKLKEGESTASGLEFSGHGAIISSVSGNSDWFMSISDGGEVRAVNLATDSASGKAQQIGSISATSIVCRMDLTPVSEEGTGYAVAHPGGSGDIVVSRRKKLHQSSVPISLSRITMQRSGSISSATSPLRLPIHRNRDNSPDSPAYRARGGRRHTLRLWTRRITVSLQRWGGPLVFLKWLFAFLALVLFVLWWLWEVHIEVAFYRRSWIENDIKRIEPLAGCFDAGKVSPAYNLTAARGPKTFEIQAGLPLRLGMDCYDFAGTIRKHPSTSNAPIRPTIFHSYWRKDLVPFGERQAWMLRSFFATQDLDRASMILWSNDDLSQNPWVASFLEAYPNAFSTKVVNVDHLAKDTALARSSLLHRKDARAWVDGDLVRLLVTWEYGGVWIDMDSLLTRDLSPLLEHEFVTQWDCYGRSRIHPPATPSLSTLSLDKIYQPLNGALMHFFRHSPYLCEAFHIMAQSPPPRPGTTDWGSTLYLKLW